MRKPATTDYPLLDTIRERWSPLAFDAHRPVPRETLLLLFEAARWAPSSFNDQPWRFIVGTTDADPETHRRILETLTPRNQAWAKNAPVLVLGLARQVFGHNGKENRFGMYDTGQAVSHLIAQATASGLHAHQMGGYDPAKARERFAIPDEYATAAVIALGYIAPPETLEDEAMREKHGNPARPRKPLEEVMLSGAGAFGTPSPLARPAADAD
jgi:Nitroreductase